MGKAMRQGFTLIEMLVALILLGLLTAIVFPVVVQQIDDAEPTKAANDLANIKTGMDVFHLNVRPTWPGDLEDLVQTIDGADLDVQEAAYNNPNKWNGPYIDAPIVAGAAVTGDAVTTGYGMSIQAQVVCYDAVNNTFQDPTATAVDCTPGTDFLAVLIDGATTFSAAQDNLPTEFVALDKLVDQDPQGDSWDTGKIRMAQTDGTAFPATGNVNAYIVYLMAPFTE
jgi:type II secretion system protein G